MSYSAFSVRAGDACIDEDCIGVLVDRGFVMSQVPTLEGVYCQRHIGAEDDACKNCGKVAFDEQRLLSCSQCGRNVATAIIPAMPTSEA